MSKSKLYLIPNALHPEDQLTWVTDDIKNAIADIDVLFVEKQKAINSYFVRLGFKEKLNSIEIIEIRKSKEHQYSKDILRFNAEGKNIGLMSDAGCPAVADPGAGIVELAHALKIQVIPLVGPSSILLALMSSGFNGQRFRFHGYLAVDNSTMKKFLGTVQQDILKRRETQIFLETPYRNKRIIGILKDSLPGAVKLSISVGLMSKDPFIKTLPLSEWKENALQQFGKEPAIFLLGN